MRLTLWSRNRKDEPQAVASHETALALHELSEILPSKIHLTVPPTFRKAAPPGVVLHKSPLSREDVEERDGFRATSPLRTLVDSADGAVSREPLAKAAAEALSRGLVRKKALESDPRLVESLSSVLGVKKSKR